MTYRAETSLSEAEEVPLKPESKRQSPLDRLAALLAPTADIEQMIAETEKV